MVEKSANQRKAFLDMLAWSGELITDVRKPEIMVMTSLPTKLFPGTPMHPRKLVTGLKLKSNRRRTLPASFPLVGCLPATAWPEELQNSDAVARWSGERGALPMIDRVDIRQAIDRCSNIWASLPGAGYGQFEHKADGVAGSQSGRNGQRDWCMSSAAIISLWLSAHHRLPVMGC